VRLAVLTLLVVNLAFFCWAHWIDTPPKVSATAERDASIPPLQLASRSPPAAAPATPATPAASGAAAASSPPAAASSAPANVSGATANGAAASARCRSVGPFEDANAANAAADRLRAHGFSPRDRSVESANPKVYWVYIGELTVDMQHRAIAQLNAAGIKDAAPMTAPEQSDRVSVGVFADQAHAVHRAEQVRALGMKPTLGMRQRTVNAHWLDFDSKAGENDPLPVDLLGNPPTRGFNSLGPVKIADCPTNSGSG
jgi:hypothetical protein